LKFIVHRLEDDSCDSLVPIHENEKPEFDMAFIPEPSDVPSELHRQLKKFGLTPFKFEKKDE
jgi:hypothetical protein